MPPFVYLYETLRIYYLTRDFDTGLQVHGMTTEQLNPEVDVIIDALKSEADENPLYLSAL